MIKKIIKMFVEEVQGLPRYKTPGSPNMRIAKPKEGESIIEEERQGRYRTAVGMLMYLVKHSRLDIMNPTRELSKVLGNATEGAYKEMKRVVKYVIDTKDRGLRIEPRLNERNNWTIEVYSDSDWAGDPDDRKSVGSFIILVCGVPVAW